MGIELESNLQLLGTVQSLDRGNHAGIRFHLDHLQQPVDFGICVEGVQLGRLNFFSIGTVRGDITCDVVPTVSRSYGSESAIVVLNHIINRILKIELPTQPYTRISMGRIRGGVSHDVEAGPRRVGTRNHQP